MNDGQRTIWGGSTAVGLPVTSPTRRPKSTSQGGVVIPLFRKAAERAGAHANEDNAHANDAEGHA